MGATTSLDNWNFNTKHVQTELDGGEFLNAASTLIAAGPPKLRETTPMPSFLPSAITNFLEGALQFNSVNAVAYPVGVVESINLAQNRQLQRLFEIGSKRSYFVNGRVVGQINLARTMFHGPSLMRAMYAYYPSSKFQGGTKAVDLLQGFNGRAEGGAPDIVSRPGYSDFFINLDSDLFDQPFGLMFMFKDAENDRFGAFYIENAYLNGHQFSINASSTLIGEAVSIQYDRLIPIDVGATPKTVTQAFQTVANASQR